MCVCVHMYVCACVCVTCRTVEVPFLCGRCSRLVKMPFLFGRCSVIMLGITLSCFVVYRVTPGFVCSTENLVLLSCAGVLDPGVSVMNE